MTRRPSAAALLIAVLAATAGAVANDEPAAQKAYAAAHDAWRRGDYMAALNGYIKLLDSPAGEAFFDAIALDTGELFPTRELTADGRNPRFSPDGRYLAFESGLEVSRRTRIVRNDGRLTTIADLSGTSATFSPLGDSVAYLKISETDELRAAAKAVDEAPLAASNRNALVQMLAWQVMRASNIVVRSLDSGAETEWSAPGLLKSGLAYSIDGKTLYFLGGREGEEQQTDVYAIASGGPPSRLSDAPGLKSAPIVEPSGTAVLFTSSQQNPFRRPQAPGAAPAAASGAAGAPSAQPAAQGRGGSGGGRGGAAGNPPPPPSFGIIDLASRNTTRIEGSAPAFSADGKTLVYVARAGTDNQLMVGPLFGPYQAIKQTPLRLDAPALSPDGSRLAYQMMLRDDWEIHLADRDGKNERRLTRDPQHDLLPRFIGNTDILSVVGEPRHRRSFLINTADGGRTRLFHNNTVRTIAPEYQWVVSAAGDQLLIGSERDGNTVSPERGVYLVDRRTKITKADLLARLKQNLASETALRETSTKTFAPLADQIKRVVADASVSRVYGYEKALFDFDSKHISQPGNKLAAEYLFKSYASFGYAPEYQWFDQRNALGGRTANVVATLRGTVNPQLVYVVSSHYDSVAGGPGADDDTSGTAALLEAARVLAAHPMPATIVFASFTGEEAGLLGSREFVRRAVENKMRIVGALNNDMIGYANDERLDNTIRYSNPGIRDIQHGAAMLFTRLITYDALYFKGTDAAAYYDAYGDIVGGIGSYPVLSSPHYHQSHDVLEFENHELITETSKTTVATLMLLASSPSRVKDLKVDSLAGGTATLSWTASPEQGVTSYIVATGPPAGPMTRKATVKSPKAQLSGLTPGTVVAVKAVNARGLEGWDWARVSVQ